jgi:hypothetical protein
MASESNGAGFLTEYVLENVTSTLKASVFL